MRTQTFVQLAAAATCVVIAATTGAQQRVNPNSNTERGGIEVKQVPGRKIGNVTTQGNLVLLELDEGVIGNHNLFDLDKRTIRFTPALSTAGSEGEGFRVENLPLEWNAATGSPLSGDTVRLTKFTFPISGKTWDTLQVQNTGIIGFGGDYRSLGFEFGFTRCCAPVVATMATLVATANWTNV